MKPKQIAAPAKAKGKKKKPSRGHKRPNPSTLRRASIEDQVAAGLHEIGARVLDGLFMAGAVALLNIAERAAATLPQLPPDFTGPDYRGAAGPAQPRPPQPAAGPHAQRAAQPEPIELKRQPDGTYK